MEMRYAKSLVAFLAILFVSEVSAKKKIASIYNEPFLMRRPGNAKAGFLPDLLDALLGAGTYKFLMPSDGQYGKETPPGSGTYSGMIGMAVNGQVDIVAADLTMTSNRMNVLDFTAPFMSAHVTVLLKKEKRRGRRHGSGHGRHKYKNVLEMLDNPNFTFMVVNGGSTYKAIKDSKIAYQRQILQRIERNTTISVVSSYDEGVEKLKEADGHDLGLLAESPAVNWLKTKDCKLYSVGNLAEKYYGLAVKRTASSSTVVNTLSKKILALQESGMLTLLIDNYFGNSKCYKKEKRLNNPSGVTLGGEESLPPWMRGNDLGGGMGLTPTGYGITVDKAYFGGEGTCNSMKLDVSDIKAAVHDLKREINNLKTRLEG